MIADCGLVDIRELKLLAEFSHPNIVKFVSPAHADVRVSLG